MSKYRIQRHILGGMIVFLFLMAGCGTNIQASSVERMPEGCTESSLVHDGVTRWYRICLPDPLPVSAPLVLYLHGGTLSMRSLFSPLADSSATWFQIAERESVILLIPNGINPETGDPYGDDQNWNDLRPDRASGQTQADDVGFLLELLDQVSGELPIDQDRIYITGASNGGMMTYRMLLEAPERFTAGAVFIANLPVVPEPLTAPGQPVPILIANGTEDPLMPWGGGVIGRDRGQVISSTDTVAWWVDANQAEPFKPELYDLPDLDPEDGCRIHRVIYPGSEEGAEVWYYEIEGGGHTLPSLNEQGLFQRLAARLLGPVCRDADGTMLAWEFFQQVSSRADEISQ